jgi:putative FmdB family regulatory protein
MPIYEYRCEECDEPFEVFLRSFSQQTELICPKCGSQRVKKAISLFAVGGTSGSKTSVASCVPGSSST